MTLRLLIENLMNATGSGLMSDAEAFSQLRHFFQEEQVRLPQIPQNQEDRVELASFIELANKISAKYSL